MTIKPLGNRVVVKLSMQKNTSTSGILLSTETKTEQALGDIIAIGSGTGTDDNIQNLGLTIGQTVMFGKYAGEEIKDETNSEITYKILKGDDILAVIER